MTTIPVTGDPSARTVDELFLDLVCSDADLLAAEFDAVIAAAWAEPPGDSSGTGVAGEHPATGAAPAAEPDRGLIRRPRHSRIGGWERQRSPPFDTRPTTRRKAGDRHAWTKSHEVTARLARTFHHRAADAYRVSPRARTAPPHAGGDVEQAKNQGDLGKA